jgi:hypothetical protein
MKSETKPDAVRSPLRYAGEGDSVTRLARLQSEFAEVLGVPRVFVRHQGTEHYITGRATDTMSHSCFNARSGESRYVWMDRGDGVLYGYLSSNG